MSLRTHAVVVQPERWTGAPAELARVLAPLVGMEAAALADALARGPMTVEGDLSASEARALADRLATMGVPAEVQPPMPMLARPAGAGGLKIDGARITDEVPRTRSTTMMGFKPMVTDEPDNSGWGAVFPDLAAKPVPALTKAAPRSLDDLEDVDASPPRGARAAPVELTPPLRRETGATPAPAAKTGGPPALPIAASPPVAPPAKPVAVTPSAAVRSKAPIKPSGFDGSKLAALLPSEEVERPPHKPVGYDPRPEHHPPFAVMFAVMAPGGGHVFNGYDDEAIDVAFRFWAVVPWVQSVRRARADAEKIRTFWAPRPDDGSGLRAFKFVFSFWLCVGLIAGLLAWGVPAVVRAVSHEPVEVGIGPEQVATSLESAVTRVLGARVKALGALERASADLIPEPKYTMTEAERSERLFAIGYYECQRRAFMMCEAMMRRVLELKPGFGPAIRLQAWASVSKNGRVEVFPAMAVVPSLNEIELNKMREEMILEGEHVPPPAPPVPAAADAGSEPDLGSHE